MGGSPSAIRSFDRRHRPRLLRIATRHIGEAYAADIVQETFLKAHRTLCDFDAARGSVATWLNIICQSKCRDWLRRAQGREYHHLPFDMFGPTFQSDSSEPATLLQRAVEQELSCFSERTRRMFHLYLDGWNQVEIGLWFGVSKNTVGRAINPVVERLANTLA